jgi:hypothetical protein
MTPEVFEQICARVETEVIPIVEICQEVGATTSNFWSYLSHNQEAQDRYARAKQLQAEILAAEILDIADHTELGVKTKTTNDGIETTEGDMIEHRKLRVDSRKWLLSKLLPKKYGDKVDITSKNEKISAAPFTVVCSDPETADILQRMACGEQPAGPAADPGVLDSL